MRTGKYKVVTNTSNHHQNTAVFDDSWSAEEYYDNEVNRHRRDHAWEGVSILLYHLGTVVESFITMPAGRRR